MINFLQAIYSQNSKLQPLYRKAIEREQIRQCETWTNYGLLKKIKVKGRVAFIPKFAKGKFRKMELVEIGKLKTLRMVAGNEKRYSKVIHRAIIKEWVEIGWIEIAHATLSDYTNYPVVI